MTPRSLPQANTILDLSISNYSLPHLQAFF